MAPRPTALFSFSILVLASLSSCAVGPNYTKPETPVDEKFSTKESGFSTAAAVPLWWRKFNDAKLNSLIDRAIAANHDLRIAAANIEEARALRNSVRFDYFPTVTSGGSYTNQRSSTQTSQGRFTGFGGGGSNGRGSEVYEAGFDATWELDLWGRVRRSNWAARADVESAEATRNAVMVAITGEVASAYLDLRGLQNQLAVARRNANNQGETLKLTESLLQGGRGTELDTSRSRALLNSTLAAIPLIESAIHQDIHRLSVLVGAQPSALKSELIKSRPMPALPSLVRIGNPADLLRRRPDVYAVEKQLEAATQRVGVATADLFPSVTFNGTAALQAESFSGLGRSGADATSFGPSIRWAAFDLGRVQAQIKASSARTQRSLAEYEQTVLGALEETENALVAYGRQRARRNYLRESANASQQAADLARERYQNGVADFLTVLDAQRELLDAQSQLAESETLTATSLVAIYKALGGGWETNGRTEK
ncbi:efflux transporter outer membrane subunit [Phragmitibacter flavus]|uniref:Efflux transporter outer membrane subunit n=1 Tax=Phragmitibacter flavus TaxID=2576071 RepID=A0A5R8K825_9BACT|nr:efflux transporter outer membrane subunit [Phragmitibacter flavus]TLD68488.1 efflux transporter outer membrane subunit [Phragmitibacter flavus]